MTFGQIQIVSKLLKIQNLNGEKNNFSRLTHIRFQKLVSFTIRACFALEIF